MNTTPRSETLVREPNRRVHEISVDEVHERQDRGEPRFEIVDVRDEDAWRSGHIPGARHIAQGALELEIAKAIPDTSGEVVVYGERGLQSLLAAATLLQEGYSRVSSLAGGWRQWLSGGGQIEK
jgi:sulfur-carrier protein adenylyltransferase/sulfurtransferase